MEKSGSRKSPRIAAPISLEGNPVAHIGLSSCLQENPSPEARPDEVLIHVKYSGVCHTDLHAMKGDWPLKRKMPFVGGHEGAGIVVAKGELVKDIEIGDHAGIK